MDDEIEQEIIRLSKELAMANERITELEQQINGTAPLSLNGPPVEQRAYLLFQYIEKNDRISSRQAKKLLNCSHHSGVHRAMELLVTRCEGVILRKSNKGILYLEKVDVLRLRSGAQEQLRTYGIYQ